MTETQKQHIFDVKPHRLTHNEFSAVKRMVEQGFTYLVKEIEKGFQVLVPTLVDEEGPSLHINEEGEVISGHTAEEVKRILNSLEEIRDIELCMENELI